MVDKQFEVWYSEKENRKYVMMKKVGEGTFRPWFWITDEEELENVRDALDSGVQDPFEVTEKERVTA